MYLSSMNGLLIRAWLQQRKMRPEELALRAGVSLNTIQKCLAGKNPSRPVVLALAHVLGVNEEELALQTKATRARA